MDGRMLDGGGQPDLELGDHHELGRQPVWGPGS
jgi:hypothetical protein